MPDPKIKAAMEEIVETLRKHDLAAHVILVSPTHSELLQHISPTWSVAKFENNAVRLLANIGDFPSVEAQQQCISATIGMFVCVGQICRETATRVEGLLEHIKRHLP